MNRSSVSWGVAASTLPGETESGDRGLVRFFADGFLAGVVDGLGHGVEASSAADRAIEILDRHAGESVLSLLKRCHEGLRSTRGVVMSLASYKRGDGAMTWLGIGNVEGLLLRADPMAGPARESLLLRPGIVGVRLPVPYAYIVSVAPGDTLVLSTDGIGQGFEAEPSSREPVQSIADRILDRYGKRTDDALVLVARAGGPDS